MQPLSCWRAFPLSGSFFLLYLCSALVATLRKVVIVSKYGELILFFGICKLKSLHTNYCAVFPPTFNQNVLAIGTVFLNVLCCHWSHRCGWTLLSLFGYRLFIAQKYWIKKSNLRISKCSCITITIILTPLWLYLHR